MSTSTSGRSERSLSDLLNIFRAPLSEDQSWAVCYQCARKLQRLRNEYGVAAIPALSLASVFVTSMGEVDVRKAKRLRGELEILSCGTRSKLCWLAVSCLLSSCKLSVLGE